MVQHLCDPKKRRRIQTLPNNPIFTAQLIEDHKNGFQLGESGSIQARKISVRIEYKGNRE